PAYLAALAAYLLLAWSAGNLKAQPFLAWDILSHVLMIHNFTPKTLHSINGVFWTLAIEEQLYLAYFLLVWLRVRFGWSVTLLTCLFARVLLFVVWTIVYRHFKYEFVFRGSAAANWCVWLL